MKTTIKLTDYSGYDEDTACELQQREIGNAVEAEFGEYNTCDYVNNQLTYFYPYFMVTAQINEGGETATLRQYFN